MQGLAEQASEAVGALYQRKLRAISEGGVSAAAGAEAAMAGALGLRLSGPRIYGGRVAEEPWLNGAGRDPVAADIARALAICRRALWLGAGLLTLLSAI